MDHFFSTEIEPSQAIQLGSTNLHRLIEAGILLLMAEIKRPLEKNPRPYTWAIEIRKSWFVSDRDPYNNFFIRICHITG